MRERERESNLWRQRLASPTTQVFIAQITRLVVWATNTWAVGLAWCCCHRFDPCSRSFPFLNRPYFSRPRKYRRLFSEPTYWPRRSRGQYGEGNNQAGIFEAEGNKSLIPGRLARSPLTCPSTRKVRDESIVSLCNERYNAGTGSPSPSGPKWFDRLFSTCNRQLADSPGG